MRLFHPTVWWKYSLFLQFSPWRNLWLRHFAGYSFETSRKKASTIFRTQPIHNISIWWGIRRQFLEIFGDNMFTSDALKRGCVIENGWWFFWSSKGITNKMFWLWIPPMEKSDKKAVVSACCGDETTTCHDRAFLFHYTSLKFTVILSFNQVILIFDNQAEAMYFLKAVIPFYFLNWLCYRKWLMFFPWSSKGITGKMP